MIAGRRGGKSRAAGAIASYLASFVDWSAKLAPGEQGFVLALSPTIAVVTNVEADHLDVYGDLAEIRRAFEAFVAPARTVVLCADDPGASALRVGPRRCG